MRARALPDQDHIISIAAVLFALLEAPPDRQVHVRSHAVHVALGTISIVRREDSYTVRRQRSARQRRPGLVANNPRSTRNKNYGGRLFAPNSYRPVDVRRVSYFRSIS